jgi:hypothetical protein
MSVAIQFIHLFIPMSLIDEQFQGGWPRWRIENERLIGQSAWFDQHLYTQGAMGGLDIDGHAVRWKRAFPELFPGPEGLEKPWNKGVGEFLVARGGRVDWFCIDGYVTYLTGTEPGQRISRDNVKETDRWLHPENYPGRNPDR